MAPSICFHLLLLCVFYTQMQNVRANARINTHHLSPSSIALGTSLSTVDLAPEMNNITGSTQATQMELSSKHEARRNTAYVFQSNMNANLIRSGLERLQFLLDYNTNNKQLLREMNIHFQKTPGYDWHLCYLNTIEGAIPSQYVYYKFDRNESQLFVGAYHNC